MASKHTKSYRKARQYPCFLKPKEYAIRSHIKKQSIFSWENNLTMILNTHSLFMKHDKQTPREGVTLRSMVKIKQEKKRNLK